MDAGASWHLRTDFEPFISLNLAGARDRRIMRKREGGPGARFVAQQFAPEERPTLLGSPYAPAHPMGRRLAYAAIGTLTGIGSTFPNALTNVNVGNIAGSLGLYVAQAGWLPAIYVAMNASANLTLVKARVQFGIPAVTQGLLAGYACVGLLQLLAPTFAAAVLVRAVNGMTGAALISLTVYYFLQVFPPKLRPLALLVGISLPQIGTPLAKLVPIGILATNHWHGLHLIELSVALGLLAMTVWLPLPPSERAKVFEPLDLVTIGLWVPAMVLICGVLGLGRVVWWTDTPWIGWMLVSAVPLFALAVIIETHRRRALIQFGWLGSLGILRFAAVALLVRLALAEQTFGSVGLLTSGGLDNDQLHALFAIVALAMVLGIVIASLTLSEKHLPYQIIAAALFIALGAFIDSGATNVTRPPQLYLSQALLGFGTTLYIGPAILYGFLRMFEKGADHPVSFVVLFSITQNVGALAGSAIMGSYQVIQMHAHAAALSEHLIASNPEVVKRIQLGAEAVSGVVGDPLLRGAEGASLLGRAMTGEASVLAYNDVFRLLEFLALGSAVYVVYLLLISWRRPRRKTLAAKPA